jgi:hypothetical protein
MRLTSDDQYIKCNNLIKTANELYEKFALVVADDKQIFKEDLNYIQSMNNYINNYEFYKEKQIKQYIRDLEEYQKLI